MIESKNSKNQFTVVIAANKIDLDNDQHKVDEAQGEDLKEGCDADEICYISAQSGFGISEMFKRIGVLVH